MNINTLLLANCSWKPRAILWIAKVRCCQKFRLQRFQAGLFQNSEKIFPEFLCISVSWSNGKDPTSLSHRTMWQWIRSVSRITCIKGHTRSHREHVHHASWAAIMTGKQGKRPPTEQHADKKEIAAREVTPPPLGTEWYTRTSGEKTIFLRLTSPFRFTKGASQCLTAAKVCAPSISLLLRQWFCNVTKVPLTIWLALLKTFVLFTETSQNKNCSLLKLQRRLAWLIQTLTFQLCLSCKSEN